MAAIATYKANCPVITYDAVMTDGSICPSGGIKKLVTNNANVANAKNRNTLNILGLLFAMFIKSLKGFNNFESIGVKNYIYVTPLILNVTQITCYTDNM